MSNNYSVKMCPICKKVFYDTRNMNLGHGTGANFCSKCGAALVWKTHDAGKSCWKKDSSERSDYSSERSLTTLIEAHHNITTTQHVNTHPTTLKLSGEAQC